MCELQFTLGRSNKHIRTLLKRGYENGNMDGVGLLTIKDRNIDLTKSIKKPHNFVKKLDLPQNAMFIGHNRYATRGKTNIKSAHPFVNGDWSWFHNGTFDYDTVAEETHLALKGDEDDVDSKVWLVNFADNYKKITHGEREQRIVEAVKETMSHFGGSFSMFLVDKKTSLAYYMRNEEKPFTFKATLSKGSWEILGSTSEASLDRLYASKEKIGLFRKQLRNTVYRFKPSPLKIYRINPDSVGLSNIIQSIGEFDFDANWLRWSNTTTYSRYFGGNLWDDDDDEFSDFTEHYPGTASLIEYYGLAPMFYDRFIVIDKFASLTQDFSHLESMAKREGLDVYYTDIEVILEK